MPPAVGIIDGEPKRSPVQPPFSATIEDVWCCLGFLAVDFYDPPSLTPVSGYRWSWVSATETQASISVKIVMVYISEKRLCVY